MQKKKRMNSTYFLSNSKQILRGAIHDNAVKAICFNPTHIECGKYSVSIKFRLKPIEPSARDVEDLQLF